MAETLNHICPACGKHWLCDCPEAVKRLHVHECGEHAREIACSLHCAEHLGALLKFLAGRVH